MTRKVVRLTLDHLDEIASPCRHCAFWEADPVRRAEIARSGDPAAAAASEQDAWVSHVLREWGSCGRVVLVDDRPVGYAIYAPPVLVPGAVSVATAPVATDAVLLTTVYVEPGHQREGLGRMLVQGMASDLIKRGGIRAVETFGSNTGQRPGLHTCLVPTLFFGSVGFKTVRPHPVTPRMRMDLRSAITWRSEVEAALERLVGVVRHPSPAPTPAKRVDPSVNN